MQESAEILAVLDRFADALREKDLDALAKCYLDDVRVYDLGSQLEGYDNLRSLWEMCFPYFANPIEIERKEMRLHATSEMAVVSFLSRVSGMETDHPAARTWFRATVCLQKIEDEWKIIHDHASLPVNCEEDKPVYLLDE